jgi:HSP20 family protein
MLLTQTGGFGWDPFSEMRRLQGDMNRLFEGYHGPAAARGYPPVNLWVGDNSLVVTTELPGLGRDDVDLTLGEDTLTIQGERKLQANDKQIAWHRRERGHGVFSRTVELPFRIDPEKVAARFHNGLLEIEMPRPKADLPRKIKISAK